jgi:hypothetical protein
MNDISEFCEVELTAASVLVSVEDESNIIGFSLDQNYPNPFNPSTTISFSLPVSSNISLLLYDASGKEIGVIIEGFYGEGTHSTKVDMNHLSSGVYFYKLKTDKSTITKKMILEK